MTRLTNKQKKLVGFKLTLGFTSLVVVLVGWILQLIVFNNQTPYFDNLTHKTGKQINYFLQNRMVFSLNYFSFFTIESNLLCILLLLVAGFRPRLEGKIKLLRTRFVLAVTVYIAMTGLVFDVFLLQEFARGVFSTNGFLWFILIWEHNVLPVGFLVWVWRYLVVDETMSVGYWGRRWLGWASLYPLIYVTVMVGRGVVIYNRVQHLTVGGQLVFYHGGTVYDNEFFGYFLLNVMDRNYGVPGWGWLVIVLTVNTLILVGVSYAGLKINNRRYSLVQQQLTTPLQSRRLTALRDKI